MFRRRLLQLVVSLLASGCAGGVPVTDAVVRDSAGVTIVENAQAQSGSFETWSLGDSAEVTIGTLDGPPEQQLFQVRGLLRLPDGRIVVANNGTKEIRFYDSTGRFQFATGRDGEGPGEFRSLGNLYLTGDSIVAPDSRLNRISILSLDGTFARSFLLPRLESRGERFTPITQLTGIFGDGSMFLRAIRIFRSNELGSGLNRDSAEFYYADRAGVAATTLGTFPGNDMFVKVDGRNVLARSLPFGRSQSIAVAGDRFYFGSGDAFKVEVYRPDGALERIIRFDRAPRAVTSADIEAAKNAEIAGSDNPEERASIESLYAEMPIPSTMPAFSGLRVDQDGNLWVGSYRAPGEEERITWTVFDESGRLLSELRTPVGFTPFQIGSDWALGRRMDELEIERIELYRLRKAES
jgi:hypothetical protein